MQQLKKKVEKEGVEGHVELEDLHSQTVDRRVLQQLFGRGDTDQVMQLSYNQMKEVERLGMAMLKRNWDGHRYAFSLFLVVNIR